MTTPSTSAVRAWARSNGYDVADRGRLPAELTDAYLAAQGKGGAKPATASAAPKKQTASRRPPAKTKAAASKAPAAESSPARTAAPAAKPEPRPKPSPVSDDRRLVALGEQLAALSDRVTTLEKALGDKGGSKATGKRFRRSR